MIPAGKLIAVPKGIRGLMAEGAADLLWVNIVPKKRSEAVTRSTGPLPVQWSSITNTAIACAPNALPLSSEYEALVCFNGVLARSTVQSPQIGNRLVARHG